MARIDSDVGRQRLQQMLQRADELPMVAAREVGAADTAGKEAVAREEGALCLEIEADATGGCGRATRGPRSGGRPRQ